jgi:hypothetical protein
VTSSCTIDRSARCSHDPRPGGSHRRSRVISQPNSRAPTDGSAGLETYHWVSIDSRIDSQQRRGLAPDHCKMAAMLSRAEWSGIGIKRTSHRELHLPAQDHRKTWERSQLRPLVHPHSLGLNVDLARSRFMWVAERIAHSDFARSPAPCWRYQRAASVRLSAPILPRIAETC